MLESASQCIEVAASPFTAEVTNKRRILRFALILVAVLGAAGLALSLCRECLVQPLAASTVTGDEDNSPGELSAYAISQEQIHYYHAQALLNAQQTNNHFFDFQKTWSRMEELWIRAWSMHANSLQLQRPSSIAEAEGAWTQSTVPEYLRSAVSKGMCSGPAGQYLLKAATPKEFLDPTTKTERSYSPQVPVAFIIYAHDSQTVHGAERLIHWLYHKNHTFVIHLDDRALDAYECYLRQRYGHYKNVRLAPRTLIHWGEYGIVQAELDGLSLARKMSPTWEFAINLCGSSVLTKPPQYLDAFLNNRLTARVPGLEEGDAAVVRYSMIFTDDKDPYDKSRLPKQAALLQERAPGVSCTEYAPNGACLTTTGTPGGKPWYKGSQWKIMSRDFVSFALDSEEGKEWAEFFKTSFNKTGASDESWAQSLVRNSRFNALNFGSAIPMATKWHKNEDQCGHSNWQRMWFSPCYLSGEEFEMLRNGPEPFARKFYYNDPVIERIRDELVHAPLSAKRRAQLVHMAHTGQAMPGRLLEDISR